MPDNLQEIDRFEKKITHQKQNKVVEIFSNNPTNLNVKTTKTTTNECRNVYFEQKNPFEEVWSQRPTFVRLLKPKVRGSVQP